MARKPHCKRFPGKVIHKTMEAAQNEAARLNMRRAVSSKVFSAFECGDHYHMGGRAK